MHNQIEMRPSAKPRVSVVMAAYNYGQYIAQAIESVINQTYTGWELIIVDDGSTDDTPDAVAPFLVDHRIGYHRQENRGQPAAENVGITLSRGEFIAFLDADDAWFPRKLECQLPKFDHSNEVGVVYSDRVKIDPYGRELLFKSLPCHSGRVLNEMFQNNFVCFSSSVVRRTVFDRSGVFNEEYRHASDYDLWLRVAMCWDFEFVDEPLVYYRTGHANLTGRSDVQLQTALTIMERFSAAHRRAIPVGIKKRCFLETYCHLGLAYRDQNSLLSLRAYLNALRFGPLSGDVWRGLVALSLPESLRRIIRYLLGRPVDWRVPKLSDIE
jgi:glycosyltransferase involved in cell wall biosynthesis